MWFGLTSVLGALMRILMRKATRLREEFGIEAARVVPDHRSAAVTEIYAELDRETAARVMAQVG